MRIGYLLSLTAIAVVLCVLPNAGRTEVIDNDVAPGVLGHFSVDVLGGGESFEANLTASRLASADIVTEDVIFDYFSYVDPGIDGGGFRLSASSGPSLSGDDEVTSSGSFIGESGNTIEWTAVSSIPDGGSVMTTVFTFTAATGTLGPLRFLQYLDEDIEGVSDDVLFTRGSAAGGDLELFTVDDVEVYGVSHSGGLSVAGGLLNATFAGWAADQFNDMKPTITGAGQVVSPGGVIDVADLPPFVHPEVGPAWGPEDIVSVLAWDVDPDATTAVINTTLGGVPEPPPPPDGLDLDHYLGYRVVRRTPGRPSFPNATLRDQFGEESVQIRKPDLHFNPVDKNEEGIFDPEVHLVGYRLFTEDSEEPRTVVVFNQFGPQRLTTSDAERLLVPSTKSFEGVPPRELEDETLPEDRVDHFKCYRVQHERFESSRAGSRSRSGTRSITWCATSCFRRSAPTSRSG
jgi:hypothetical protein